MAKIATVNLLNGKVNEQFERNILEFIICNIQQQ